MARAAEESKTSRLAAYYDRNTRAFLRLGVGGSVGVIHRGLWPPGVNDAASAARVVHRRLVALLAEYAAGSAVATHESRADRGRERVTSSQRPLRVADFGCGVGATLCEVATAFPSMRGVGITLSETQVVASRARAEAAGLADRVIFECADFEAFDAAAWLATRAVDAHRGVRDFDGVGDTGGRDADCGERPGVELSGSDRSAEAVRRADRGDGHEAAAIERRDDTRLDAIWAIEAFAHAPNPQDFLVNAARQLKSGGLLVVVDDFLVKPAQNLTPAGRRRIERFARGWHLPALDTPSALIARAQSAALQLVSEQDLTPLIRLRRPRDRLARITAFGARVLGGWRYPFFANVIGGDALNAGLRHGELSYRWLVFRREGDNRSA
ncbi:MAG: methyltransferase domain-containing protein [Thioalkalivibrionaceae bacterium]